MFKFFLNIQSKTEGTKNLKSPRSSNSPKLPMQMFSGSGINKLQNLLYHLNNITVVTSLDYSKELLENSKKILKEMIDNNTLKYFIEKKDKLYEFGLTIDKTQGTFSPIICDELSLQVGKAYHACFGNFEIADFNKKFHDEAQIFVGLPLDLILKNFVISLDLRIQIYRIMVNSKKIIEKKPIITSAQTLMNTNTEKWRYIAFKQLKEISRMPSYVCSDGLEEVLLSDERIFFKAFARPLLEKLLDQEIYLINEKKFLLQEELPPVMKYIKNHIDEKQVSVYEDNCNNYIKSLIYELKNEHKQIHEAICLSTDLENIIKKNSNRTWCSLLMDVYVEIIQSQKLLGEKLQKKYNMHSASYLNFLLNARKEAITLLNSLSFANDKALLNDFNSAYSKIYTCDKFIVIERGIFDMDDEDEGAISKPLISKK